MFPYTHFYNENAFECSDFSSGSDDIITCDPDPYVKLTNQPTHIGESSRYQFKNQAQYTPETDSEEYRCCDYKKKQLTKGKFGLAYVIETPKKKITTPTGWQVEFEDTPSKIMQHCDKMERWVNCPPLGDYSSRECPDTCAEYIKGSLKQNKNRYGDDKLLQGYSRNNIYNDDEFCTICDRCREIDTMYDTPKMAYYKKSNKTANKIRKSNGQIPQTCITCHNLPLDRQHQDLLGYNVRPNIYDDADSYRVKDNYTDNRYYNEATCSKNFCNQYNRRTPTNKVVNSVKIDLSCADHLRRGDDLDYVPKKDQIKHSVTNNQTQCNRSFEKQQCKNVYQGGCKQPNHSVTNNQTQCERSIEEQQCKNGCLGGCKQPINIITICDKRVDKEKDTDTKTVLHSVETNTFVDLRYHDKETEKEVKPLCVDKAAQGMSDSNVLYSKEKLVSSPIKKLNTPDVSTGIIPELKKRFKEQNEQVENRKEELKPHDITNLIYERLEEELDSRKQKENPPTEIEPNKDKTDEFKILNYKKLTKKEIFTDDLTPLQKIKLALKIQKREILESKLAQNMPRAPENTAILAEERVIKIVEPLNQ
ncbi:uncharacterized protein [Diabrotica undecimpunctata]|uniref:uncharacterized protein n=1 Tax=Diabrotica undecimpunctata TaxID=50387 RepID=UPI003B63CF9A